MKKLLMAAVLVLAGPAVYGQTAVSADGVIESTSGGLKSPDGTVQATAAGPGLTPVEDTGRTQCFDTDGNSRSCVGTGEDGEFQAGVTWPTPRFTDNGDGTVTDNLTGLIWLMDANCPAGTKTWQQALNWVESPLNSGGTYCIGYTAGTFTDWRLPNIKELLSLVDYSERAPVLPPGHPFVNVHVATRKYWSSSTFARQPPLYGAWGVSIQSGGADGDGKTSSHYVWPVRGGQ